MRRRTLYKAERVGDEFVFATDPRHSMYEQARREAAEGLVEEAECWQKAYAEARDLVGLPLAEQRDLVEAGTTLADVAARACTEPRRFHENEGDHQQALSLAVAQWRLLAALYRRERDETEKCPGCGGDASDSYFDRSLCACGSMHYYCRGCGAQLDSCR